MFAFCTAMLGFEYDPDECSDVPPEGKDYKNAKFAPERPNATQVATDGRDEDEKGP